MINLKEIPPAQFADRVRMALTNIDQCNEKLEELLPIELSILLSSDTLKYRLVIEAINYRVRSPEGLIATDMLQELPINWIHTWALNQPDLQVECGLTSDCKDITWLDVHHAGTMEVIYTYRRAQ